MSGEEKASIASTAVSYSLFPAITVGGGALKSVKRNHGIKSAVDSMQLKKFKEMNASLKTQGADAFTRSNAISEAYSTYSAANKNVLKASNKLAKLNKKGNLPVSTRITNLFKSKENKTTVESLKNDLSKTVKENTKNVDDIIETAAKNSANNGLKQSFKSNLKENLTGGGLKTNVVMTLLFAVPKIKDTIPVFKEKGFKEGMKQVGAIFTAAVADIGGSALLGAAGSAIGGLIGSILPGAGTVIGQKVGFMVGSMAASNFVYKKLDNVLDKEENSNETTENMASNTEQIETSYKEQYPSKYQMAQKAYNNYQKDNNGINRNLNLSA